MLHANMNIALLTGQLATSLVQEFLQFFNLKYSLAVFEPEVGIVSRSNWIYIYYSCVLQNINASVIQRVYIKKNYL